MTGYRSADSYLSRDPEKRAWSLANLTKGRDAKGKKRPLKAEGNAPDLDDPAYRDNIVAFAESQFFIPETRQPIRLLKWQKRQILRPLFHSGRECSLAMLGLPTEKGIAIAVKDLGELNAAVRKAEKMLAEEAKANGKSESG